MYHVFCNGLYLSRLKNQLFSIFHGGRAVFRGRPSLASCIRQLRAAECPSRQLSLHEKKREDSRQTSINMAKKAGWLVMALFCFCAFAEKAWGKEKVLDLGEIEIKGEVRRPNINLIYSKKYFDEALTVVAKKELKNLESRLLKPAAAERPGKKPGKKSKK